MVHPLLLINTATEGETLNVFNLHVRMEEGTKTKRMQDKTTKFGKAK